jgi:hypothetical protein
MTILKHPDLATAQLVYDLIETNHPEHCIMEGKYGWIATCEETGHYMVVIAEGTYNTVPEHLREFITEL